MPEFQLNRPARRAHPFYSLDTFARGYVEAMFFTNCDTGNEEREDHANELGVERLTRASVAAIKRDCLAFLSHIMPDGCTARQWLDRVDSYDDAQAGRDFWLTRQGHGAGFWDRDSLDVDLYAPTPGDGDPSHDVAEIVAGGWIVADDSAGKWEGAAAVGNIRDGLSDAARLAGESYVSIYRGWIHVP
jgi:hypothetical protein